MVYVKPDGTQGFSWKNQHEFLLREHPDKAAEYQEWGERLREKIDAAADQDDDFGFAASNLATKEFVKENDLMTLFADVPGLSSQIDELDFSFLEEDGTEPLVDLTEANFDAWLNGITLD